MFDVIFNHNHKDDCVGCSICLSNVSFKTAKEYIATKIKKFGKSPYGEYSICEHID